MAKKVIIGVGVPQDISMNLQAHFNSEIFEFIDFAGAQELLSNIKRYKVSLIFIYNILPDLKDCQELCIVIRSDDHTETVPLIVISDSEDKLDEKIKMLQSGLIDGYLSGRVSPQELSAYATVFLQRQTLEEELELKNELLGKLSITDDLTKLYNRRYLIQRLDEELKRIKRHNYPLSCMMFDIDHFKRVNDMLGHSHGDLVLEQLAELIKKTIRSIDIICRYGGEEIVVVLPYTNLEGAFLVAERLRKRVEEYAFGTIEKSLDLTISIGLVSLEGKDNASSDSLFQKLDAQLYEAKNSGRNKICGALYKNLP